MPLTRSQNFRTTYIRRVLIPGGLILLVTAVFGGLGLLAAGREVDELSLQGQEYEAYRALGREMDELSLGQETIGSCERCVAEATSPNPDSEWLRDNIAARLAGLYDTDQTYILDGEDRPVFAAHGAETRPADSYAAIAPSVQELVDLARGRIRRPGGISNIAERLPNSPLPEFSAVRTSPSAIHATDLVPLPGVDSVVSVMRMVQGAGPDAGADGPLLVNVRYLDQSFLDSMERQNFLLNPHFEDPLALEDGESSIAITTSSGTPMTNLAWTPQLPARLLEQSLLPVAAGGFAIIALLVLAMSLKMRQLMRQDQESLRELKRAHVELQAKEAQAHHLAYHDVLTGLPNRAMFNENAEQMLIRARHGEAGALLLVDLDRFKHINDRYGHLTGDELIRQVARRMTDLMTNSDSVGRLGGDEFAVLLHGADLADGIEARLRQFLLAIGQPFEIEGNQMHVGASIGVVTTPEFGTDRTDLMRKADIALYCAKEDGRDTFRFFEPSMDETVQMRSALEAELREALQEGDQLSVHFQPQVDGPGNKVIGVEALLRWQHPERGCVPPGLFVPVAEETGLIHPLGELVLVEACKVAKEWPDLTIAVNLSPMQFADERFAQRVCDLVAEANVNPRQIELEVTESVVLDRSESTRGALQKLRGKGFRVALDDFGTGYSSLSYLREFEVDKIKIDKSFIQALGKSVDSAAIVTAVVTLGHAMGLRVTAEGVETRDQEDFLRVAGCEELQGFLYAKAVPASELAQSLKDYQNRRAA